MRRDPPLERDDSAKALRDGLVGPPRRDFAAMGRVSAEALWRAGYRQIEQTLALLVHAPDVDAKTLRRFARGLAAHLRAADNLLYPMVETARKGPLTQQRQLNRYLRCLLAEVTKSGVDKDSRRRWLSALEVSFRKHARLDEASILLWFRAEPGSMPLGRLTPKSPSGAGGDAT